jgi:hypothetical protein
MPNPFTSKIWSAQTHYWRPDRLGGSDLVEWDDAAPFLDATLIRTLVWVSIEAYSVYEIGAGGIPSQMVGFGLGETTSSNFNGNFPSDDPSADFVDYIAFGSTALNYTALGWPPNSSASLSGSINSIDSSGTIDTVYNLNTYMYGSATMFVDSRAQRRFGATPHFQAYFHEYNGGTLLSNDRWGVIQTRMLWEQNA